MKTRIVSLVYEVTQDDGTVDVLRLEDGDFPMGEIKFCFHATEPAARFWIASSHEGLMSGNAVIASPPNDDFDPENVKNRTNELIGKIQDGHCHVFCSYEVETLGMVMPPVMK
jgi:hypothetical protein